MITIKVVLEHLLWRLCSSVASENYTHSLTVYFSMAFPSYFKVLWACMCLLVQCAQRACHEPACVSWPSEPDVHVMSLHVSPGPVRPTCISWTCICLLAQCARRACHEPAYVSWPNAPGVHVPIQFNSPDVYCCWNEICNCIKNTLL